MGSSVSVHQELRCLFSYIGDEKKISQENTRSRPITGVQQGERELGFVFAGKFFNASVGVRPPINIWCLLLSLMRGRRVRLLMV